MRKVVASVLETTRCKGAVVTAAISTLATSVYWAIAKKRNLNFNSRQFRIKLTRSK
jgi:hypothetical protein